MPLDVRRYFCLARSLEEENDHIMSGRLNGYQFPPVGSILVEFGIYTHRVIRRREHRNVVLPHAGDFLLTATSIDRKRLGDEGRKHPPRSSNILA